jgi:NAD(P)H-dependent FMN reductase
MSQVQDKREPVRFLVFSASLRSDSLNSRLTTLAADTIEANGGQVDRASMADFDTPSFDADLLAT